MMADDGELVRWLMRQIDALQCEVRELRARLNGSLAENSQAQQHTNTDSVLLTPREIEVARLICQRITTEAIAAKLVTTPGTIKKHRQHIKRKLGVSEWPELEQVREVWDKP